jgi:hypothetical protein
VTDRTRDSGLFVIRRFVGIGLYGYLDDSRDFSFSLTFGERRSGRTQIDMDNWSPSAPSRHHDIKSLNQLCRHGPACLMAGADPRAIAVKYS